MTQNELNSKTLQDNASTNFHTINLLQLIPKMEQNKKFTNFKFNSIKVDKGVGLSKKNSLNKNTKNNIKQNTTSLIYSPNIKFLNNISVIKDSTTPTSKENNNNNIIPNKNNNPPIKKDEICLVDEFKAKSHKDPVIAFFNRNFYSCEVPVSKKIIDNQKILDYYLKDKENKEKIKQLLKINKSSSNNKYKIRNLNLKQNSYKKYDIKNSLMLNDFRVYNRIHQVVRFWSKFINYACPIFQVQKFTLNSQKYKDENNNASYSMDNFNKSCFYDKNIKLPKLYTNSSKIFKIGEIKDNKFFRRNKSTIDSNSFGNLEIKEDK